MVLHHRIVRIGNLSSRYAIDFIPNPILLKAEKVFANADEGTEKYDVLSEIVNLSLPFDRTVSFYDALRSLYDQEEISDAEIDLALEYAVLKQAESDAMTLTDLKVTKKSFFFGQETLGFIKGVGYADHLGGTEPMLAYAFSRCHLFHQGRLDFERDGFCSWLDYGDVSVVGKPRWNVEPIGFDFNHGGTFTSYLKDYLKEDLIADLREKLLAPRSRVIIDFGYSLARDRCC